MRRWNFVKDDSEEVMAKVNKGLLCRMDVLKYVYYNGGKKHPYIIIYRKRLEFNKERRF